MFPLWAELLPKGQDHDPHYRPACDNPEGSSARVFFAGSCAACVIAQHAQAMQRPKERIVMADSKQRVSLREATNRFIVKYGLPLPLVA